LGLLITALSKLHLILAGLNKGTIKAKERWKARRGGLQKKAKGISFSFERLEIQEAKDVVTNYLQELIDRDVPASASTGFRPLPWWEAKCVKVWRRNTRT